MGDILSEEEIDAMLKPIKESRAEEEIKTEAQAIEAIKKKSYALQYVPEKFKTEKFYIELAKSHKCFFIDQLVPERFRTAKFWFEMVKKDASWFMEVPEEFKTADMYAEAVKKENWILMLVPENLLEQVVDIAGIEQEKRYKYESVLEKGMKEVFEQEAERICLRLIKLCENARREGILALENYIDKEKLLEKNILEIGMQMAIEAREKVEIEAYFDDWIEANCNNSVAYYEKILASIIKTGVLAMQIGENPMIAEYKMTVLIPRDLIPDSLWPGKKGYFRNSKKEVENA